MVNRKLFDPLRAVLVGTLLSVALRVPAIAQTTIAIANFQGTWTPNTNYGVGTVVSWLGLDYIAINANSNRLSNSPDIDTTDWQIFSDGVLVEGSNTSAGKGALPLVSHFSGSENTAYGNSALATIEVFNAERNTAVGSGALFSDTRGNFNTATGSDALRFNSTGHSNTASGDQALYYNTTGSSNTASGYRALVNNTADNNTAAGALALNANTTGTANTATGYQSLQLNVSGVANTANGYQALQNSTGSGNTALGSKALISNTGNSNTAVGLAAMLLNNSGSGNTAVGPLALGSNKSGGENVAVGDSALAAVDGAFNIAVGAAAGSQLTAGSRNIYIGSLGPPASSSAESATIRIGNGLDVGKNNAQLTTYIAGIINNNVTASGVPVFITPSGQLGTGALLAGPPGPMGPAGPQGAQGLRGSAGTPGLPGATGPIGPVGPAGATGPAGPAGTRGATGPQGSQGIQGTVGPAGIQGPTGTNGTGVLTDDHENTSAGVQALAIPSAGQNNTAFGSNALNAAAPTGQSNTAFGASAAQYAQGFSNVAVGARALFLDQTGNENVAMGNDALQNFLGSDSVAVGGEALSTLRFTGSTNVAVGYQALVNLGGQDIYNPSGLQDPDQNNIALGANAGRKLYEGDNNIYIGSAGGSSNESATVRIGTPGTQTNAYFAGITTNLSNDVTALPVVVDTLTGQLGTSTSIVGTQGPVGPAGPQGPAGSQGQQGNQGVMGVPGATGPAGPAGPIGLTGPIGPVGATGPTGPQGAQGSAGANGSPGAQGPAGPQGAVGLNGVFNYQGAWVATTIYPADAVVTENGSSYVTPTGSTGVDPSTDTSGSWVTLALAGAQGLQGVQGNPGAAGPQGNTGATGPAGPAGPIGLTGPVGPVGATGATGAQGSQGVEGPTGPQGIQGPAGPQGPQGPTGATGAGFNFLGPYSATTPYNLNAVVNYRGSAYIAFSATPPGTTPPSNPGSWGQIANGVFADSSENTAAGTGALPSNTNFGNSAFGNGALGLNTNGNSNTAVGWSALGASITAAANVAIGATALSNLDWTDNGVFTTTNSARNVAIGDNTGSQLISGQDNIYIGTNVQPLNGYDDGYYFESGNIRIGLKGSQTAVYIQGINGVTTGLAGSAVVVDANGQLGTISSSRRYKEDIEPMADASDRLLNLRPVKFKYKKANANGEKPIQYGLIAEEVAEVLPELVVNNKDGQPETVAYHLLPAMLLNELQKEHQQLGVEHQMNLKQMQRVTAQENVIRDQAQRIAKLESQASEVDALKARLADLERVTTLLAKMSGGDGARVQKVSQWVIDSAAAGEH